MIDDALAKAEIEQGLAAVCAYCERYHNSQRGDEVMCGQLCGGPEKRKAFPQYKGPLEGNISVICYLCGNEADTMVNIGGKMLGVCRRMGPNNQTCLDKFKLSLQGVKNIVVKEHIVPVVGAKE